MAPRLQEAIAAAPAGKYDAILLGFALCNNGILGLRAGHTQLVVPRAHDCITLFLGARAKYRAYFDAHPGTFYLTSGWIERDTNPPPEAGGTTIQDKLGLNLTLAELKEKYGEENAAFLLETLGDLTKNYSRMAYIDIPCTRRLGFRECAEQAAAREPSSRAAGPESGTMRPRKDLREAPSTTGPSSASSSRCLSRERLCPRSLPKPMPGS